MSGGVTNGLGHRSALLDMVRRIRQEKTPRARLSEPKHYWLTRKRRSPAEDRAWCYILAMSRYTLVIGNANYSSWSLRAWLYMKASGIDFQMVRIPLFSGNWREEIAERSPAGRVPILLDAELGHGISIWDTMAIIEHLREQEPDAVDYPFAARARAEARSVCAEMHSGFMAVRAELPMNIRHRRAVRLSDDAKAQVQRLIDILDSARARHRSQGKWLFGDFSIADVFFAPVALRFVTYGIEGGPGTQEFIHAITSSEHVKAWSKMAAEESESLAFVDELAPATETPLRLG